jgi:hypothetical protein
MSMWKSIIIIIIIGVKNHLFTTTMKKFIIERHEMFDLRCDMYSYTYVRVPEQINRQGKLHNANLIAISPECSWLLFFFQTFYYGY